MTPSYYSCFQVFNGIICSLDVSVDFVLSNFFLKIFIQFFYFSVYPRPYKDEACALQLSYNPRLQVLDVSEVRVRKPECTCTLFCLFLALIFSAPRSNLDPSDCVVWLYINISLLMSRGVVSVSVSGMREMAPVI